MEADISSQAVGLASNTDFSIISLFLRADIIVKSVMIILIASSVYSWAIIFDKIRVFRKINKSAEEFEDKFWKSKSAETFYNNLPASVDDPMAQLFKTSMQTVIKSRSRSTLSEKLPGILEINIEKQMSAIDKNYTFLATVGSTASNNRLDLTSIFKVSYDNKGMISKYSSYQDYGHLAKNIGSENSVQLLELR